MSSVTWTLLLELYQLRSAINDEPLPTVTGASLEQFLVDLAPLLGAVVLGKSNTDYDPAGASTAVIVGASAVTHLDKSHLAAHTYFADFPQVGLNSHRLSMELSTCSEPNLSDILPVVMQYAAPDAVQLSFGIRGLVAGASGLPILPVLSTFEVPPMVQYDWRVVRQTPQWIEATAVNAGCPQAKEFERMLSQGEGG